MKKDNANQDLLLQMEKAVLEAFKNNNDAEFTKHFSDEYIGIANDGIKDASSEVQGMHRLKVQELSMEDERVTFPTKDVAIMVYTMVVKARLNGEIFSGKIYSSSVYVHSEGRWVTVLHTESKA